jgi:predicted phosphodiesterase
LVLFWHIDKIKVVTNLFGRRVILRIALFSDIHGNSIALDAVLEDIRSQGGVDSYWVLGDLVAIGYDPVGVLERLARLSNAYFTRGNADRYVVTGDRPPPTLEDVSNNLDLLPVYAEVMQTFAWTQGALAATDWLTWLAELPLEQHIKLPDGTRVLGVHASPGNDGGPGITPDLSEIELQGLLKGCYADLIFVGHTHWPLEMHFNGVHLVNVGSVSNPMTSDLRASYNILDGGEQGYIIKQRRVAYDRQAVIAELERVRHPAAYYIIEFMLGKHQHSWQSAAELKLK